MVPVTMMVNQIVLMVRVMVMVVMMMVIMDGDGNGRDDQGCDDGGDDNDDDDDDDDDDDLCSHLLTVGTMSQRSKVEASKDSAARLISSLMLLRLFRLL